MEVNTKDPAASSKKLLVERVGVRVSVGLMELVAVNVRGEVVPLVPWVPSAEMGMTGMVAIVIQEEGAQEVIPQVLDQVALNKKQPVGREVVHVYLGSMELVAVNVHREVVILVEVAIRVVRRLVGHILEAVHTQVVVAVTAEVIIQEMVVLILLLRLVTTRPRLILVLQGVILLLHLSHNRRQHLRHLLNQHQLLHLLSLLLRLQL